MAEMSKLLGQHSLAVMMDAWKCFGTVKARLVASFKMPPRAVKGFGYTSFLREVGRGHIAWLRPCHHHPHRAHDSDPGAGTGAMSGGFPSSLVDDGTLQWIGKHVEENTELVKATREPKSGMRRRGPMVQPVKSGCVGTAREALK
eukprot:8449130-Pyramimonas_sp.AAC.1